MDFDAIVIGAGISGLYQLHSLMKLGLSSRVLEAAPDLGGTWYWNRYPGCRFDSESFSYGYSWSRELLEEWNWSELFAGQPETYRYLQHVADKFDLRKHIEFNSRVRSASFDEDANLWTVETEDGRTVTARFVVTGVGILSAPVMPEFPGRESFAGRSFHTTQWPDDLDLTGLRVAVFGTGATGVQVIQTIAPIVGQLTVYQRSGNWTKPLRNRPLDEAEMGEIKARYPEIFARCRSTAAGFIHDFEPRNTFDVSEEERQAFYEEAYADPGFRFWLGGFQDVMVNEEAAREAEKFLIGKIRERVKDPKVADLLIPKDHPFGAKRVPLETNYYEAYNRPNVELVDLKTTPVERITPRGVVTGNITGSEEREFDVIIYATGFDAFRGALDRIEFVGVGGQRLADKWSDGVKTYLGMQVSGFPNLLSIIGPHGGTFCNVPRCIEQNVEFITGLIAYMRRHGYARVEASEAAETEWTQTVLAGAEPLVIMKYDSYVTSKNSEVLGHKKKEILAYVGGQPEFIRICDEVAANDYRGFIMSGEPALAEAIAG